MTSRENMLAAAGVSEETARQQGMWKAILTCPSQRWEGEMESGAIRDDHAASVIGRYEHGLRKGVLKRGRAMKEGLSAYAQELCESADAVTEAADRFEKAGGGMVSRIRTQRMSLTPEVESIAKGMRDLVTLVSGKEFTEAMDRMERLVTLAERMKVAAADGWLDKTCLAIMERT